MTVEQKTAPTADKSESKTAPDANKVETTTDNNEDLKAMREQISALEKRAKDAERKLESAARKGKSADELQAALEKREEEATAAKEAADALIAKRDKLFAAVLKPRLEALPEQVRELVKRAGKESPEALLEALELAEKGGARQVQPVQGGPLANGKQAQTLEDGKGNFDIYGGFGEIAKGKPKG